MAVQRGTEPRYQGSVAWRTCCRSREGGPRAGESFPLRSREYQKDGVKHRVFECKADPILKLDRTERTAEPDAHAEPVSKEVLVLKGWMLATTMLAIRTMSDGKSLAYELAWQPSRERGVAIWRTA